VWPGNRPNIDTRYALGLEVIFNEDHRESLVAVMIVYNVGTKDDPPGAEGLAHFFEHLMFQGSRHVGEDMFFRHLEHVGVSTIWGETRAEIIIYGETVAANQVELALWVPPGQRTAAHGLGMQSHTAGEGCRRARTAEIA
jgi:predicted Zn-dependent peptidase